MKKEKRLKLLKLFMVLISISLGIFAMYLMGEVTTLADLFYFSEKQNEIYKYLWAALFLPILPIIIFLVDLSEFFPKIKSAKLANMLDIAKFLLMFAIFAICIYLSLRSKSFIEDGRKFVSEKFTKYILQQICRYI